MIKILGTGSYLPEKIIYNTDLPESLGTSDEWISSRTGIKKRHIAAPYQKTSDLAINAAQNALKASNIQASEIDGIIVGTCTPDQTFPATAIKVQKALGIRDCFAYDLNAACSGFMYAFTNAVTMLKSGDAKNILAIGADIMSRIVNWNDRATCVLFGDGAGAMVLAKTKTEGKCATKIKSIPNIEILYADDTPLPGAIEAENLGVTVKMKGREVFKYAVDYTSKYISELIAELNLDKGDIDHFVLHQANKRIIEGVADKISVPSTKFVHTVAEHANTSAASIPLAFDSGVHNGYIKRGSDIIFASVGAGLTLSVAYIKY